jgi:hypothetical protein
MNTKTKQYMNVISNNGYNGGSGTPPVIDDDSFVTHTELSLVYSDIKDDINKLENKVDLGFIELRKRIAGTKEFISVREEIRASREESHRELMEVKNELIERFDGRLDELTKHVIAISNHLRLGTV